MGDLLLVQAFWLLKFENLQDTPFCFNNVLFDYICLLFLVLGPISEEQKLVANNAEQNCLVYIGPGRTGHG